MKHMLCILLLMATSLSLPAMVRIHVEYDSYVPSVGQPLKISGAVSMPEGWTLVSISTNEFSVDVVAEILMDGGSATKSAAGRVGWQATLQILEVETFLFPGFTITLLDTEGAGHTVVAGRRYMHVQTPMVDLRRDPPILGLKDPVPMPARFPWFIAVIILLLVAGGAAFYWYKKHHAAGLPGLKEIHDPWILARERLERIEDMDTASLEQRKEVYFLLTETVRMYLTGRTGLHFMEATTGDIMDTAAAVNWLPGVDALHAMLFEADLVKFAKQPVSEEECRKFFVQIRAWIELAEKRFQDQRSGAGDQEEGGE